MSISRRVIETTSMCHPTHSAELHGVTTTNGCSFSVNLSRSGPPVFSDLALCVPLANCTASQNGERLVVMSKSRAGKTQLFKTLTPIGVDVSSVAKGGGKYEHTMTISCTPPTPCSNVCASMESLYLLVSTTPNHTSRDAQLPAKQCLPFQDPMSVLYLCSIKGCDGALLIFSGWGLDSSMLDQHWSSFSGDESWRASLTAAMALAPDIV